ncbi:hypothetical protein ABT063_47115 [Streptomyces sp. NPDC002838]|uniref:hypothetical protein n=1 Tax=Streptomyces sp. NPDC002838 TaxID=3154436 RepID=UPI003326DFFA
MRLTVDTNALIDNPDLAVCTDQIDPRYMAHLAPAPARCPPRAEGDQPRTFFHAQRAAGQRPSPGAAQPHRVARPGCVIVQEVPGAQVGQCAGQLGGRTAGQVREQAQARR